MAIIPARYASTRFPGKPLAMLGGKPVVQWVYEKASSVFDIVAVATDDKRISDTVSAFGGRAIITSPHHRSGTDRVREAHMLSGENADVIVNIQGDEPFVDPSQLMALKSCFDYPETDIATLVRPFKGSYEELSDPNKVKVVCDDQGFALYFSRSVIPYVRGTEKNEWPSQAAYHLHIGLYGYRAEILERVAGMPPSPLEIAESLEQLRWLQAGLRIRTAQTNISTIGIDTPADLEAARRQIEKQEL
mgnify:FL=1